MSQQFSTQRRQEPQSAQSKKEARRARYAAINATWKQLRPDLRHSAVELREARLDYAAAVNGIAPIGSLADLTIHQLDRVIEAMKRDLQQPAWPVQSSEFSVQRSRFATRNSEPGTQDGAVVHLATEEEAWAVEQVLDYLGWSDEGRQGFLRKNFRRATPQMLTHRQAKSAITVLLTIAASRDIKKREGETAAAIGPEASPIKVSRLMIRAEMPSLKKRIGIDRMNRINRTDQI
jgi:hypothetical protein